MMQLEFEDILALLVSILNRELDGRLTVQEGYLKEIVEKNTAMFGIDEGMMTRLVKHLETYYGTTSGDGSALKKEGFREWFPQASPDIDFYYWRRLRKYWKKKGELPVDVVRSVDQVTDEIMGFLGNPADKESWNRRSGLVMGHVQSGKTTNYAALVSKAADAGYKIIIVLAGLTNSLRYQPQVRMDKTFVGKSSVSDSLQTKYYDVSRYSSNPDNPRSPYCGTSQISDFSVKTARQIRANEGNFADPILFVTKKNKTVLKNLADWLESLAPSGKLEGPLLLIDDEADNASINTEKDPDKSTQINERIRALIATARQSCYVGYTATPFANIFIDPDSTNDWEQEDLFPADFIKSLEPPNNYVGAERLFSNEGDLGKDCLRPISGDDYQDVLPLKHRSGHIVEYLPETLLDAVQEFVLFRAMRIAMGEGNRNSSMLVNVSRFINVQEQIEHHLAEFVERLSSAIGTWASTRSWEKSDVMIDLLKIWEEEYDGVSGLRWDEVRQNLKGAVASIETRVVNLRGGEINYEKVPKGGLHVIAIGGLALARGLTLEGLAVSYVLRNIGAADTLLQMGRWFGYRPGYERLCRIHATPALIAHFQEVSGSVEELRVDFERMERLGLQPIEFGLKVRQSPTGIAITAANKMRSAEPILLAEDFSARHVQAYKVFDDVSTNTANRNAVDQLFHRMSEIKTTAIRPYGVNAMVWSSVSVSEVIPFLAALDLPQTDFMRMGVDNQESLVEAYIRDRSGFSPDEFWDIAIPFRARGKVNAIPFPYALPDEESIAEVYCRERHSGIRATEGGNMVKITQKNAVAFGDDDLRYGEEDAIDSRVEQIRERCRVRGNKPPPRAQLFAMARKKPLLVIHLLDFRLREGELDLVEDQPVVTVSILFPPSDPALRLVPRRYIASKRLLKMMSDQRAESETEEEVSDE